MDGRRTSVRRQRLTLLLSCFYSLQTTSAFLNSYSLRSTVDATTGSRSATPSSTTAAATTTKSLQEGKRRLLRLLRSDPQPDDVLADPVTKEGVTIVNSGTVLGGLPSGGRGRLEAYNAGYGDNGDEGSGKGSVYSGSTESFLNFLEPSKGSSPSSEDGNNLGIPLIRALSPFVPPPLRSALASTVGMAVDGEDEYIPMRDLFTSPAVSFAYERGWRDGFARAGFPGPDVESKIAMEYFAPAMVTSPDDRRVLVDMSCATGLFTRRFAESDKYRRVIGCDYSASMLTEARRRGAKPAPGTHLDWIRCDVGNIPMRDASVDALHAGAAMHCWPDLKAAASEIHRVLRPGGRYFATTFLSSYFSTLRNIDSTGASAPSQMAFQYFSSIEQLRDLLEGGGFAREKIFIEVLGTACVVIRCEK